MTPRVQVELDQEAARREMVMVIVDRLLSRPVDCIDDLPGTIRQKAEAAAHVALAYADIVLERLGGASVVE